MNDLRKATLAVRAAQTKLEAACVGLLSYQRLRSQSYETLHVRLRVAGDALLTVAEANAELARVLTLDPEHIVVGGRLDDLVPPLIEHVDA